MDLATIDVTEDEARAKLAEYEEVLIADRTAEDEALAQAYRAVRRGLPVIRLSEAVKAGGFFPTGLPRIAVVRADATQCWVRTEHPWMNRDGRKTFVFSSTDEQRSRGALVGASSVRVTTPGPSALEGNPHLFGRTTVPLIPPSCRPRRPRLASCHVLWEVEAWDPTPPRDPALIRHLRGDLWSVLAVWDLTELERAVLSQRVPH